MKFQRILTLSALTLFVFALVGALVYFSSQENNEIAAFKRHHSFKDENIRVNMFLPSNKNCIEKCKNQEIAKDRGFPCGKTYQVCCLGERNCKVGKLWDTCSEKINAFFCEG